MKVDVHYILSIIMMPLVHILSASLLTLLVVQCAKNKKDKHNTNGEAKWVNITEDFSSSMKSNLESRQEEGRSPALTPKSKDVSMDKTPQTAKTPETAPAKVEEKKETEKKEQVPNTEQKDQKGGDVNETYIVIKPNGPESQKKNKSKSKSKSKKKEKSPAKTDAAIPEKKNQSSKKSSKKSKKASSKSGKKMEKSKSEKKEKSVKKIVATTDPEVKGAEVIPEKKAVTPEKEKVESKADQQQKNDVEKKEEEKKDVEKKEEVKKPSKEKVTDVARREAENLLENPPSVALEPVEKPKAPASTAQMSEGSDPCVIM